MESQRKLVHQVSINPNDKNNPIFYITDDDVKTEDIPIRKSKRHISLKGFLDLLTLHIEGYTVSDEFLEMFPEIATYTNTTNKPADRIPLFVAPNYPEQLVTKSRTTAKSKENPTFALIPAITYGISRMGPGNIGGVKMPFHSPRELKLRWRENLKLPDSSVIHTISEQKLNAYVKFNIWCKNNGLIEELCEWFMNFMEDRFDYYQRFWGIGQIFFEERLEDEVVNSIALDKEINVRTLTYFVETTRTKIKQSDSIETIDLYINNRLRDIIG